MSNSEIDKNSELYRHQCEARDVMRWRWAHGRDFVDTFLSNVEKKRGTEARTKLEKDVRDQWMLGNRGTTGQWL